MDGARFANAVVALGVTPKEITWEAGVDVLCFGGSKNGIALGEAVVFFNPELAREFDYRCKQGGQLASKMRFLSAPWVGMLQDGAWLRHAKHSNAMARRLEAAIRPLPQSRDRVPGADQRRLCPAAGGGHSRACTSADGNSTRTSARTAPGSCAVGTRRPEDVDAFAADLADLTAK